MFRQVDFKRFDSSVAFGNCKLKPLYTRLLRMQRLPLRSPRWMANTDSHVLFLCFFITVMACLLHFGNAITGKAIHATVKSFSAGTSCRTLQFDNPMKGKRLVNHVIQRKRVNSEDWCKSFCLWDNNCATINFREAKSSDSKYLCELNDSDEKQHPGDLINEKEFSYHGTKSPCKYNPCKGNEICQTGFGCEGYRCICPFGYIRGKCYQVADLSLYFAKKNTTDYVLISRALNQSLVAVTGCLWMQSDNNDTYGTPFSYATSDELNNEILLYDFRNFDLCVGNRCSGGSYISANDGMWHHICFTWESNTGFWNIYKDGALGKSGKGLNTGHVIAAGGILVLGQDQDSVGGSFDHSQAFVGNMSGVNVWNRVLTAQEISMLSKSCHSGKGSVLKWSDFGSGIHGVVQVIQPSPCKP